MPGTGPAIVFCVYTMGYRQPSIFLSTDAWAFWLGHPCLSRVTGMVPPDIWTPSVDRVCSRSTDSGAVSDCSPYRTHPIRVQVDNPSPTAIHQLAVSSPLLGQSR